MRGKDIATAIINRPIDYKNMTGNEKYYNNFYSVNKLMYLAHCEYLKKYSLLSNQKIGILSKKDEAYLEECSTKDKIITNEMILKYIYNEKENNKEKTKTLQK